MQLSDCILVAREAISTKSLLLFLKAWSGRKVRNETGIHVNGRKSGLKTELWTYLVQERSWVSQSSWCLRAGGGGAGLIMNNYAELSLLSVGIHHQTADL